MHGYLIIPTQLIAVTIFLEKKRKRKHNLNHMRFPRKK